MKKIRVLQVVTQMHRAGLETMLINYFRHIDRNIIVFDFLTHREGSFDYDEEIKELGGRIYTVPGISPKNFTKYLAALDAFFSEHNEYGIVHCHLDALSAFVLRSAKNAGVPVRIAHSHNNGFEKDGKIFFRYAARTLIPMYATHFWGCSKEAVRFMFKNTKNLFILPNAIDVKKFAFTENDRNISRNDFNVNGKFVVGNVGRLCYQKNQEFLLEIFAEIKKIRKDAVLIIAGEGDQLTTLRKKARFLNIYDDVRFICSFGNIPQLLSAMDVFVFPSRFEGFGIALLEAQASELSCVASDVIVDEVRLSDNIKCLSLNQTALMWARAVLSAKLRSENLFSPLVGSEYDISVAAKKLCNKYLSFLE